LSQIFIVLTFALSLLLVFKTNSSFARWWEGRIIWGQASTHIKSEHLVIGGLDHD
jgi:predicted membrane chloride channel (bestrophin family)